jgi:hypothetical protein
MRASPLESRRVAVIETADECETARMVISTQLSIHVPSSLRERSQSPANAMNGASFA